MSFNEIRGFIFENCYKWTGFSKENSYYSIECLKKKDLLLFAKTLIEKIPHPCNAKEHYQSFLRKKNSIPIKKSEVITYQPKTFENLNIVDIKSVIIEHPKTSHKLSKTVRKAGKVGSNSSLNSDTKNSENILNEKHVKITKRAHVFKRYASTYNVEISNSFNPELQLKDNESAIKSKLIQLLTQLKGFKFVATLFLVFKNIGKEVWQFLF